jgi:hypothetical protein
VDDLLFSNHIEIRAIPDVGGRLQPVRWLEGLQLRDRRRAAAGMENYDRSEAAGLPSTGRTELVRGRRHRMLELKLTRGGTPGPQLRFLGVRRGRTFWVAHAFTKTRRAIPRKEIATAERVLDQWRGPPDDGDSEESSEAGDDR